MSNTSCPELAELEAYVSGQMDEESAARLEQHLETCPDCQSRLATLDNAEASLISRLRRAGLLTPYEEESGYEEALARARAVVQMTVSGEDVRDEASPVEAAPLREIGEYRLLGRLGQGGMGTVYRALHVKLEKTVALKVLPPGRMQDPRALARFEREMKAIGRLNHPNIVQALDARDVGGTSILVMEYVEGENLSRLVRHHGPLRVADACELVRQAAVGLQYVFENGLVHRDIKPSNLMLNRIGQVKILDLGLALLQTGAAGREMTGSEQAMGTADYVSPEQVQDAHNVDIRADIYSLGCTLYKLLAGRAPFGTPEYHSTFGKMLAHVQREAPPIRDLRPEVSPELAAMLDRMLAKSPEGRYATPADVARTITRFTAGSNLPALLGVVQRSTTLHRAATASNTVMDGTSPGPASAMTGTVGSATPAGALPGDGLALTAPLPSVSQLGSLVSPEDLTTIAASDTPLARNAGEGLGTNSPLARQMGEGTGSPSSPLAREAGEGQGVRGLGVRRRKPLAIAVALGLLGLMILLGVVIRYRDPSGRERSLIVDNNTEVTIGPDGSAQVKPIASNSADTSRGREETGVGKPLERPKPVSLAIKPQPLAIKPGQPVSELAFVAEPPPLPGVRSWSLETLNHRGEVSSLAYSPDGSLLASAGTDGKIILRDTRTEGVVRVLLGHGRATSRTRVCWSPQGNYLASIGEDEAIRLWDVRAGSLLRTWGDGDALSLDWSPQGKHLTVGFKNTGEVRFLDSSSGDQLGKMTIGRSVERVAWSPDGGSLAVLSSAAFGELGKPLGVWLSVVEFPSLEKRFAISIPDPHFVMGMAWSPDGRWIATGTRQLRIWDAVKGELRELIPLDETTAKPAIAWAPDSTRLYFAEQRNSFPLLFWNLADRKLVEEPGPVGMRGPFALACSPDGKRIAVADIVGEVRTRHGVWNVEAAPQRPVVAGDIALSPDGKRLGYVLSQGGFGLWPISPPAQPSRLQCAKMDGTEWKGSICWNADGTILAGRYVRQAFLWNGDAKGSPKNIQLSKAFDDAFALSHDGKHLAVGFDLWNTETGKLVTNVGEMSDAATPSPVVKWSPLGGLLAVGQGKKVAVYREAGKTLLRELVGCPDAVSAVAWSNDGKRLAAKGGSPWVGVWDAESGRLCREFKHPSLTASHYLRWFGGNERIAVGTWSGISVCEVSTGKVSVVRPGFRQIIPGVDVSPNGELVAWRQCGTIRLHRMADGKPLATLLTLPGTQDAVISPDGHWAGPPEAEQQLAYVVLLDSGEQQTLTPAEFAKRYGWKNDPSKALRRLEH